MSLLSRFFEFLRRMIKFSTHHFTVLGVQLAAEWNRFKYGPFSYKRLGITGSQIRVIQILPQLTSYQYEPVRCILHVVSLDDYTDEYIAWDKIHGQELHSIQKRAAWVDYQDEREGNPRHCRFTWGDYLTISYTWGSNGPSNRMIINGRPVYVTHNLDVALRCIRTDFARVGATAMGIKIWVDALCIDQKNEVERNREVSRMLTIYKNSISLIVHLGPQSDDSDIAIKLIRSLAKDIKERSDCADQLVTIINQPNDPLYHSYRALVRVLSRPYWSRLWVIQELAMADERAVVFCGEFGALLEEVRQVAKFIITNILPLSAVAQNLDDDELKNYQCAIGLLWWLAQLQTIPALAETRTTFSYNELRSPVLTLGHMALATLPQDKVFGLLGILPFMVSKELTIDYSLPPDRIFLDFTTTVIKQTGELDIIYAKSYNQKTKPSWVLDLTVESQRSSGIEQWIFGPNEKKDFTDLPEDILIASIKCQADSGRGGQIEFCTKADMDATTGKSVSLLTKDVLKCNGFCIGQVDGISQEYRLKRFRSDSPLDEFKPRFHNNPYPDREATSLALIRALLMDPSGNIANRSNILSAPWFFKEGKMADGHLKWVDTYEPAKLDRMREMGWQPPFRGGLSIFDLMRYALQDFQLGGTQFKDFFPHEVIPYNGDESIQAHASIISANLVGRRLVTMDSGRIGLAPAIIQPGDSVYILLGCSMPVVLRPCDAGYWEIVGECFIDGFMKGEGIASLDSGIFQLEDICLC